MSEYQYLAFRAVDRPVTEKNLDYMRRQSSRAEITPWTFENEYHYGDFQRDAVEMLRRGYDVHLHYADFGIRRLLIRLPQGLSDLRSSDSYVGGDSLQFLKDKQGSGGCLSIEPWHEPGDLDDVFEIQSLFDRLVPLRRELLEGDLRPLYLAHLAVASDGNHDPAETREAPVPAGLKTLSDAQRALAELYDLSDEFLAAAAQTSPPLPAARSRAADRARRIRDQPETLRHAGLTASIEDPNSPVRLAVPSNRTILEIRNAEAVLVRQAQERAEVRAARRRATRLASMAADPAATLEETERLVAERTGKAYSRIGELLADLREALAGSRGWDLAEKQAQKLKAAHPRLRLLISELRRQGFVP